MLKTFQSTDPNAVVKAESIVNEVRLTQYDYNKPVQFPEPLLTHFSEGRSYPVAGRGMMGALLGLEKSGKSFVASELAVSHLTGGTERLNFELKMDGNMIYLDTEQSDYFYSATQRRIHDNAGKRGNVPNYTAYHLRRWAPHERILAIEEILYTAEGLQCVILDGLVDLLLDFNSVEQSMAVMQLIMRWSVDLNLLLITVLHTNKTTGTARGHLGSLLGQKVEFLLKITQEKRNEYLISNPTGRFLTFPDMAFSRDEGNGQAIYLPGKIKHNFL